MVYKFQINHYGLYLTYLLIRFGVGRSVTQLLMQHNFIAFSKPLVECLQQPEFSINDFTSPALYSDSPSSNSLLHRPWSQQPREAISRSPSGRLNMQCGAPDAKPSIHTTHATY